MIGGVLRSLLRPFIAGHPTADSSGDLFFFPPLGRVHSVFPLPFLSPILSAVDKENFPRLFSPPIFPLPSSNRVSFMIPVSAARFSHRARYSPFSLSLQVCRRLRTDQGRWRVRTRALVVSLPRRIRRPLYPFSFLDVPRSLSSLR